MKHYSEGMQHYSDNSSILADYDRQQEINQKRSKYLLGLIGVDHIDWINPDEWLKDNRTSTMYFVYYLNGQTILANENEIDRIWKRAIEKEKSL